MEMLGVPLGPPRLPNAPLEPTRREELQTALEQMGFFGWL
jgi:hypothetical protein